MRASTAVAAHCEPCSEVSSSRSVVIILVFLGSVVVVALFAFLSKLLPASAMRRLGESWHAITEIYRV